MLMAAFVSNHAASAVKITADPLATNSLTRIDSRVESWRAAHELPALTVAVCSSTELLAAGVAGLRKIGDDQPALLSDKFHIGSCTKSMTALLAALLVERGALSWTNSLASTFPAWQLPDRVRPITLEQLLNHRSGIDYIVSPKLWTRAWEDFRGTPRAQRAAFLQEALQEKLKSKPGAKFLYSNTGYAAAGAMLETAADKSWEDLIRAEIFTPLHMTNAGFGPPSFPTAIDQPWGHQFTKSGSVLPKVPHDNPIAIAPAGAAHCSIFDLAQYAAFHLRALQGKVSWITPALQNRLYSPPKKNDDYALGWIVLDRDWAGGKALTHAGSNTYFYTVIWLAPARDRALLVMMNAGLGEIDKPVLKAGDAIIEALISDYLQKP